jgi:hypothetical protein
VAGFVADQALLEIEDGSGETRDPREVEPAAGGAVFIHFACERDDELPSC